MAMALRGSSLYDSLSLLNLKCFINHNPDKTPIKPNEPLTLDEALSRSPLVGMIINQSHPLVAFDLDGVSLNTPQIKQLLTRYPTYVERTPSGKPGHYRLIYLMSNKDQFRSKPKLSLSSGHVEFFNTSGNYITLTGNEIQTNQGIEEIPADVISDLFPSFRKQDTKPPETIPLRQVKPSIDPDQWVALVPCDRDNPLVRRYCEKHNMDYQTYWLTGIMALHYTLGPIQGKTYADAWSQKSNADYDYDELSTRWTSLNEDADRLVTDATYVQYYNECIIPWPKTNKQGTPVGRELSNTQAFLDYHELSIEIDSVTTKPFIYGPDYSISYYYKDPKQKYYKDHPIEYIVANLAIHVRQYNFHPEIHVLKQHIQAICDRKEPDDYINRFVLWLETLPMYDPDTEPDYLQLLSRDIIQRNDTINHPTQEFHETLIRKWMLSIGRSFYNSRPSSSEGMLILSGPPGIGKSSLCERLLPSQYRGLHVATAPNFSGKNYAGMSQKDYKSLVCSKLIVDYDEAEEIFTNNTDAIIKSEITETVDSFRPAYGRSMLQIPRKYSIYASTNENKLAIPIAGDRRYWWLNVKDLDTYLLDNWPVDRMWKQIEYELRKPYAIAPWLLTESEQKYLSLYLIMHRKQTDIDMVLCEMFDWAGLKDYLKKKAPEVKRFNQLMYTRPEISDKLNFSGLPRVKTTALAQSIKRLNQQYAPEYIKIGRTKIYKGYYEGASNKVYYFLPPLSGAEKIDPMT